MHKKDKVAAQHILDWFKEHGPSRSTPMRLTIGAGLCNSLTMRLSNMYMRGEIARRFDGTHQGKTVYLWGLHGTLGDLPATSLFRANEILTAFQAAARQQILTQSVIVV